MELTFRPITRDQAQEYTEWEYRAPYDLYNIPVSERCLEIEEMLKEANRTFAVVSNGDFVGIRSFGKDGRVSGGVYDDRFQDTGGALRPDLTGKGLGETLLSAGLHFGSERFGFGHFRVTVASFNQRALTVCERVGFKEQQRFLRNPDKREFVILTLTEYSVTKTVS